MLQSEPLLEARPATTGPEFAQIPCIIERDSADRLARLPLAQAQC
jgi:hypothetical protein